MLTGQHGQLPGVGVSSVSFDFFFRCLDLLQILEAGVVDYDGLWSSRALSAAACGWDPRITSASASAGSIRSSDHQKIRRTIIIHQMIVIRHNDNDVFINLNVKQINSNNHSAEQPVTCLASPPFTQDDLEDRSAQV